MLSRTPLLVVSHDAFIQLEGCGATIGLGDSLTVASAVAESACYFMIRSDADDLVDAEFSEALATYWCKTLAIFLCVQGVSPISMEADLSFGGILGKTLCRLDEASFDKDKCAIYLEKDWFWMEELPKYLLANDDPEVNRRFNNFLKRVEEHRRTTKQLSHLFRWYDVNSTVCCQSSIQRLMVLPLTRPTSYYKPAWNSILLRTHLFRPVIWNRSQWKYSS